LTVAGGQCNDQQLGTILLTEADILQMISNGQLALIYDVNLQGTGVESGISVQQTQADRSFSVVNTVDDSLIDCSSSA